MRSGITVAIDGPAGAGKSTVAKMVAARLELPHVDTGSIYRAITLAALRRGTPVDDGEAIAHLAGTIDLRLEHGRVVLDGEDVTGEIRSAAVNAHVSLVSRHARVRSGMVDLQRRLVEGDGGVMEGRDIGTVILPDADLKVFLTASSQERARRRHAELREEGIELTSEQVLEDIAARDRLDSEREISPLKAAHDAVVIDSTHIAVEKVVDEIVRLAAEVVPGG